MPDLSIIIVNYNTCEPLRRCLQSIQAYKDNLDVEIIVVDNGSKDGSANMVLHEFHEVNVIEPGRNTWFTGGNNLGLKAANGDFVLILNPDTVVQAGTLPQMVSYLRRYPQVGALTCQMRYPNGVLQYTCSRMPRYLDLLFGYTFLGVLLAFWRKRRREQMWYTGWQRDSNRSVEVIPDSCLMALGELLCQIDGFDERLKLYFTEDDICRRILAANKEIHFLADVSILHEEHASTSQVQRLASQVYFYDLVTFSRKYHGALGTVLLWGLLIPTRWAMDVVQRLRGERNSL